MTDPENVADSLTSKQHVWDDFACWSQHRIAQSPEAYVVKGFPYENEPWGLPFIEWLGPLDGKSVLDLGCGLGYFSVYAAKSGAKVIGIDLQLKMLLAACLIGKINGVRCQYNQANMSRLPFLDDSFDIVVGLAILHHLSRPDLIAGLSEVHRVLREGGKAIFLEPVENSRMFNFIQNLFPAGRKHSSYYRPSCLYRRAWTRYALTVDGRDITSKELVRVGMPFKSVSVRSFGLLNRFDRFFTNQRLICLLHRIDNYVLKLLPLLTRYSRQVLVEYRK
jgi:2-polyprenyl-3-methyl-5-hydroxy-6-metoxy-1,4-benzoquinol methylase